MSTFDLYFLNSKSNIQAVDKELAGSFNWCYVSLAVLYGTTDLQTNEKIHIWKIECFLDLARQPRKYPGSLRSVLPTHCQGYRKFETVQYNRLLNPELSNQTRKILRHVDKVSKLSKIGLYTLQDNLEQNNHPSRPFYCSSILPSALGFFFVV